MRRLLRWIYLPLILQASLFSFSCQSPLKEKPSGADVKIDETTGLLPPSSTAEDEKPRGLEEIEELENTRRERELRRSVTENTRLPKGST